MLNKFRRDEQAKFDMGPDLLLEEVLRLELHQYADEVGDVLDRAQKEDKMEASLSKLQVRLSPSPADWRKKSYDWAGNSRRELNPVRHQQVRRVYTGDRSWHLRASTRMRNK